MRRARPPARIRPLTGVAEKTGAWGVEEIKINSVALESQRAVQANAQRQSIIDFVNDARV
jgi:hypothetical protein